MITCLPWIGRPGSFSRNKSLTLIQSSCSNFDCISPSLDSVSCRVIIHIFGPLEFIHPSDLGVCVFALRSGDDFLSMMFQFPKPSPTPMSLLVLTTSCKLCHVLLFGWPAVSSTWSVAFGAQPHLGKSQTAVTKPKSTRGD